MPGRFKQATRARNQTMQMNNDHGTDHSTNGQHKGHSGQSDTQKYLRFAAMIGVAAVVMYIVMYFNTWQWDHVYFSWTRFFMTMMSTGTMAIIMLLFMRHMYTNKKLNWLVVGAAVVLFGSGLALVRTQATVGDVAWMEGMIPHHSIAILTSTEANISDPRVKELADSIIEAQEAEITEMKALIEELR